MPQTRDRFPGARIEEEIQLEDRTGEGDPSVAGSLRYVDGAIKGRDATGVFDVRSGSGLSEAGHAALRQLIHFIDNGPAEGFSSGAYREIAGGVFYTSVIWYEDSTKAKMLVSKELVRNSNQTPATITWKVYDTDGSSVLATVVDTITYSGVTETSRERAIS